MSFYRYKWIVAVIAVFFFIKLFTLSYYNVVWWDSAVYIGMGKYIFSLGNSGLWESSRPIVWPSILGLLWRLGLNPILSGRIAEIIFGSLCVLLTYLIGKKLFNENTALLASIFLALSPTFFFFNGIMLTETVSTFFVLLGVFFLIEKKHLISGIFFGMAFMARFLQIFVLLSMILIYLFYPDKKYFKNTAKIFAGFIISTIPYLILNQTLYDNLFLPFFQQIYLTNNSGWFNYHTIGYYFLELFKENFLYLLSFFGSLLIFNNNKGKIQKMQLAAAFFVFFIFFNSIRQKEMRFLIILLPYMYLLMAYFIVNVYNKTKLKSLKNLVLAIVILSLAFSFIKISSYYKEEFSKYNLYKEMQNIIQEDNVKGNIWVSNPIIAVLAENKAVKLIYYPVFNENTKEILIKEKSDFIFLDFCDLVCNPDSINCNASRIELLHFFKKKFKTEYSYVKNGCGQYIFKR